VIQAGVLQQPVIELVAVVARKDDSGVVVDELEHGSDVVVDVADADLVEVPERALRRGL